MRKNFVVWAMILIAIQLSHSQNVIDSLLGSEKGNETPLHIREVPRHNFLIDFGILQSTGDYSEVARAGVNIGLGYDYYFNKNFALSGSLRHAYNEFGIDIEGQMPFSDDNEGNYSKTSIAAGFNLTLRDNRFQFDAFLRGGIAFIDTPNQLIGAMGDIVVFQSDPSESASSSGYGELGVRFNYYFRKQVQLYFSPLYSTTFSEPVAFTLNGRENVNMSNLHFNVGIKIALGKSYSNGERREIED
ncbi:MAG: outer membrane beta-barrel protein [Nonlabens sp.]